MVTGDRSEIELRQYLLIRIKSRFLTGACVVELFVCISY
jgi:hypothetical protein